MSEKQKDNGMIEKGNIDLQNRPIVENEDGSFSTVRSMSFEEDGMQILIPTVSDDGRIMTEKEAIEQYHETGKHLGKFDSVDSANKYAETLHQEQENLYKNKRYANILYGKAENEN